MYHDVHFPQDIRYVFALAGEDDSISEIQLVRKRLHVRLVILLNGKTADHQEAHVATTIRENPRRLEVTVTLTDPVTFTKPLVVTKTWLYTPDVEIVQDTCSQQPGKADRY